MDILLQKTKLLEAQIILRTIAQIETPFGKEKLALILKGSKSKKIIKREGYGGLYWCRLDVIENYIEQLINMGFLCIDKEIQFRPVIRLTPAGAKVIAEGIDITLQNIRNPEKYKQITITPTIRETGELFKQYKDIKKVAETRKLVESTILEHLSVLILFDEIDMEDVLNPDIAIKLEDEIHKFKSENREITLRSLKEAVPEASWGEVKCAMAGLLGVKL